MPEHQQIQQSKKPDIIFQKQATPVSQNHVSNPYSIIQRARINPKSLTHADVMQLQRTIGNRAVGRLLSGIGSISTAQQATVQRKEIPEEEEPLQGKMAGTIQRQGIPEEEEPLQGKFENKPEIACPSCFAAPIVQRQEIPEEEEPLQGKMIGTVQRQEIPEEEEPLQIKRENNTGMPDNLKTGVENLSGIDMSDVKVNYNSSKPAQVGALAYTQGTDIHVAPGQERHLPHEAWHVVQQKQGRVRPTMQMKGVAINDEVELEHEADVMGERAFSKTGEFFQHGACDPGSGRGHGLNAHELTNVVQQRQAVIPLQRVCYSIANGDQTTGDENPGSPFPAEIEDAYYQQTARFDITSYEAEVDEESNLPITRQRQLTPLIGNIDHIVPASLGGGGLEGNGRALSAVNNIARGNNFYYFNNNHPLASVRVVHGGQEYTLASSMILNGATNAQINYLQHLWIDPWALGPLIDDRAPAVIPPHP